MTFEETPYAWVFGSGLTLTDWTKILRKISDEKETRTEGEVSIATAYVKALETLGSPQIRNVARIGGSIFYTHPCSDLLPLHIACEAWYFKRNFKSIFDIHKVFYNFGSKGGLHVRHVD
jgi:hypothetical protein